MTEHGGWSKMEIGLGLAMGLGIGLGVLRLFHGKLAPPEEDEQRSWINEFGAFFVLVVAPWKNFDSNIKDWMEAEGFPKTVLGLASGWWVWYLALLLTLMVAFALYRHHKGKLSFCAASPLMKAQLLCLTTFWLYAAAIFLKRQPTSKDMIITELFYWTVLVAASMYLMSRSESEAEPVAEGVPQSDPRWLPGWKHVALWLAAWLIWIPFLTWASVAAYGHELTEPRNLRWPERYEPPAAEQVEQ
jgi:cbb3-type cytochrome oxidase subunit 3